MAGAALVALSVALHAAVLAWAQAGLVRGSPHIHGEQLPVRAVQVSQMKAGAGTTEASPAVPESAPMPLPVEPSPPAPPALPEPPTAAMAPAAPEPTLEPTPIAAPQPLPEVQNEPEADPAPVEVTASQPATEAPPTAAQAGQTETASDGASAARLAQDYHPGRELTRRPLLITPITLDLPIPDFRPDPSARLRMRLLIGADGRVDHVLVEASTLDPLARDAAIARFTAARYKPGEIQGEPVRSQVLIEVGYSGQ